MKIYVLLIENNDNGITDVYTFSSEEKAYDLVADMIKNFYSKNDIELTREEIAEMNLAMSTNGYWIDAENIQYTIKESELD